METRGRQASSALARVVALGLVCCAAGCASTSEPRYRSFADVPYDYPNERTIWSAHAGLRVHVAELNPTGRDPLVLLHPWGTNMLVWHDVAAKLAEDRRVILIDLPGHGKSGKPFGAYTLRRNALAVNDVLDQLQVHDPVIAGNSLGGATAIELASLFPRKIGGTILIGSPGGQQISEPLVAFVKGGARAGRLNSLTDTSYYLGFWVIARRMSPLAERMYADLIALRDSPEFPQWAASTSSAMVNVVTWAPKLEEIKTPALVLHGTADLVVAYEDGEQIAARLPNAKFEALEGCGHMPELECPALLLSKMKSWLAIEKGQRPSSAMSSSLNPSK